MDCPVLLWAAMNDKSYMEEKFLSTQTLILTHILTRHVLPNHPSNVGTIQA